MSPGRIDPTASRPTQPRPAALLCAAPTRPARGVSGFWIRQVNVQAHRHVVIIVNINCSIFFSCALVALTCFVYKKQDMQSKRVPNADVLIDNAHSSFFGSCRIEIPTIPRAGSVGEHSGAAGRRLSRTRRRQNSLLKGQATFVFSKGPWTNRVNVFPEAPTSEILCTPNAGTKQPFEKQFESG